MALSAEPAPTRPSAQATAMACVGCCLTSWEDPSSWTRVVRHGGLRAAVSMLRRADSTEAGRERALGLCLVMAMALPVEHSEAFRDADCLSALHEASSSGSAKARETAKQCMACLLERGGALAGAPSAEEPDEVELS